MGARTRTVLSSKGGGLPPFLLVLLLGSLLCARLLPVSAQDGDDAAGSIYRRPLGQDPETLDPARISDTYGRTVSQQIFDGLVQFYQTLAAKPALAAQSVTPRSCRETLSRLRARRSARSPSAPDRSDFSAGSAAKRSFWAQTRSISTEPPSFRASSFAFSREISETRCMTSF